MIALGYCYPK